MRLETRQVRIGERVGDVDWSFDFEVENKWDEKRLERFRTLDQAFHDGTLDQWEATTDGGWPRCGWGEVSDVGMYDGWPYWKPVPSFYLTSWMGGSWHSFLMLSDVKRASNQESRPK